MKRSIILLLTFFISFSALGQTSGCCTKTLLATCNRVDRNDGCSISPAIIFNTGLNSGIGNCDIPAGAVITTCRITLSDPQVGALATNLSHVNIAILSGTAMASADLNTIGAGLTINWDALGGVPVSTISFDAIFSGTNSCSNNHSHTASVNISIALCWQLPAGMYYQSATGTDGTYLGNCMTNIDCAATLPNIFADNGTTGSGGLYSININNIYRSFCPNTPGKCISANVEYYQIETFFDYLNILNGPTQGSTQIATLTGSKAWGTPINYTSTDSSGCLSFRFYSNIINPYGGFYITMNCVNCAAANNYASSDCEGAINACGFSSYNGSSNGPGLISSCNGCMLSEHYTTWYYFETASSGNLALTIVAHDNLDDYDFALYQANDCSNLGTPVRCSYAAITADGNTGMAAGYTDVSEGASGNGWVSDLSVTSAQRYYLVVNNWSPGDAGFNLDFSFTGGTLKPCVPLPIEMLEFKGSCNKGQTELRWTTATEINNDYWAVMKSTDNTVFKTSGYVMGAGNSNEVRSYYFKDPEENKGTVYYKLKQVDFDGSISYSKLLEVQCSTPDLSDLTIINLQDQGYLNLSFSAQEGERYTLKVMSMEGKLVYHSEFEATGQHAYLDIPVNNLKPGIYRVSVQTHSTLQQSKVLIF